MRTVKTTDFLKELGACPIVASVQASEGSPVDHPYTLLRLAKASANEGVRILRLQGLENIQLIKGELKLPVIGLIKRDYPGYEVYITPSRKEVEELLASHCEVIALDGTQRLRPGGESLKELIERIHSAGKLAMADCDCEESLLYADKCGADLLSTTLAGYTAARPATAGPDLELLRAAVQKCKKPVLAEGRYSQPHQAGLALSIGACGVVIGGALNDPVKQTRAFLSAAPGDTGPVGAVDIGGTWLRFGVFSPEWKLLESERVLLPPSREDRLNWIIERVSKHELTRVGVSTGGVVDPVTRTVTEAKPLIPDHVGTDFRSVAKEVFALNDGLATGWGHACLPELAGRRVATVALGTGVGAGFVYEGKLWTDPRGNYPRLNDLPAGDGCTFEELLGGAALTSAPSDEAIGKASVALLRAIEVVRALFMPEEIVLCGGVALADWMDTKALEKELWQEGVGLIRSPFGQDAGLYGAAALALFPVTQ